MRDLEGLAVDAREPIDGEHVLDTDGKHRPERSRFALLLPFERLLVRPRLYERSLNRPGMWRFIRSRYVA